MSASSTVQVPWASLAVIVTLVSGTLLSPQAFDLLRPAEKERAQARVGAELEVDARLWEDPFTAVRRHENERLQRCEKDKKGRDGKPESRECDFNALRERRGAGKVLDRLDMDRDGDYDEALVIGVLVPGNPFVGAEESRRRTRYALLTGLQAERYLPDNAEHIGVMNVDVSALQPRSDMASADILLLPYEVLSDRRDIRREVTKAQPILDGVPVATAVATDRPKPYRRLAVLWIDESALPSPKLDGLAYVLQAVLGKHANSAHVALIGPSTSDGLRNALARLNRLASDPRALEDAPQNAVRAGLHVLARARMFNAFATIADEELGVDPLTHVEGYVRDRMKSALRLSAPPPTEFVRTMATDDEIAKALADELRERLPAGRPPRIVTITESDSIYSRALQGRFEKHMKDAHATRRPEDRVYFYRGVDGMTVREPSDRAPGAKDPDAPAAIEWPESRDQLDYLRRMAAELRRSEAVPVARNGQNWAPPRPIDAIGIFANDVHDKLLILQALHESFPDKVFFTTDMDARYLHPRALPFTRNLIVASSLPLQFPVQPIPLDREAPRPRQLYGGMLPFRDAYQASAYMAARLAACTRLCDGIKKQVQAAVASPSVYEISRESAVAVDGLDLEHRRAKEPMAAYFVVIFFGLGLVLMGLFLWPKPPAVRTAFDNTARGKPSSRTGLGASAFFVALYCALFAFMTGSAVEALAPGSLGLRGVAAWGLLAAIGALAVYPGAWAAAKWPPLRKAPWLRRLIVAGLIGSLAAMAWQWLNQPRPHTGEPLLWLQGISGWPSHFINLLALLLGLVALDWLWSVARGKLDKDHCWLDLPDHQRGDQQATPPGASGSWNAALRWLHKLYDRIRVRTLLAWRNDQTTHVDFAALWQGYRRLGSAPARLMRVTFWYLVAGAVIVTLFWALSDNGLPAVPVRGSEHRALVTAALTAALFLLPLVVVAVADATMLAFRLIKLLSQTRTAYPPQTVARFAAELGPEHAKSWCKPIHRDPSKRGLDAPAPPDAPHSLLDDWIDIQVITRRTDAVAPLVLAPMLMLALLVVARSRLFDNWALTWPMAASAALYVLWLGLLAVLLKQAAERARAAALERMNADLLWLQGAKAEFTKLAEPMKRLIAAVESNRTGAFAPPFDQWFLKGMLVPLGGAGAAQLLERLLTAR